MARPALGPLQLRTLFAFVLTAYFCFHLWELAAAWHGPHAFAVRFEALSRYGRLAIFAIFFLIPLVGLIGLGGYLRLSGKDLASSHYGSPGLRRLQRMAALAAVVLIAVHLWHVWWPSMTHPMLGEAVFSALYHDMGKPLFFSIYVVGITALLFQWSQGVAVWAVRSGWAASDRARRRWRLGALVLALLGWLVALELIGFFATGSRLSHELIVWLPKAFAGINGELTD